MVWAIETRREGVVVHAAVAALLQLLPLRSSMWTMHVSTLHAYRTLVSVSECLFTSMEL